MAVPRWPGGPWGARRNARKGSPLRAAGGSCLAGPRERLTRKLLRLVGLETSEGATGYLRVPSIVLPAKFELAAAESFSRLEGSWSACSGGGILTFIHSAEDGQGGVEAQRL